MAQAHWRDGGAVNAIEKMGVVMDAIARLRDEWRGSPAQRHDHLPPGDIVPVKIGGGEWTVTYPASCWMTCEVTYLPGRADSEGWGRDVEAEIADWVARAAAADAWLAENPPVIEWDLDIPPSEVDPALPIVGTMMRATAATGKPGVLGGLDSWYDAATFTRFGETPSIGYGPRSIEWAHTVDEYVPVDDLVACAGALAIAAVEHCGVAE
jgi:acetylornithine deacetylase